MFLFILLPLFFGSQDSSSVALMPADQLSLGVSIIAVLIALVAVWFAARAYQLKSGFKLRGSYSVVSSISCADKYIGSVTVENLKDRSVAIFKIFLEVSHGYYIELENFERQPLILGPFAVCKREYEPIEHYSAGMARLKIDALLESQNIRKRLVLSTSAGRYVIRRRIDHWDPIFLSFKNYFTAVIQPMRAAFDGKAYGSNARYVVRLTMSDGKKEVIPIRESSHTHKVFRGFDLTEEALRSRDALEEFLLERAIAGDLNCADLSVFDLEAWRREVYRDSDEVVEVNRPWSWFTYHLLGPVHTWWSDFMLRRQNRANHKKRLAKLRAIESASADKQEPEDDHVSRDTV